MAKSNKGRKFFATTATAALVASAIVPVASAAQINDFNSISSYAQEAVQDLNDRGVIKGDQKGNFNPKSAITRAEAATILAGALELEGSGSTSFTDVKKSAWYYDAIDAAVANGIFQGQGAGKFNPSANLTRSEAAIILVDAFGLEGSADLKEFKDSASVKSWAEEALSIAVANGVMKGDDNGNLKPNASITRQDFALMYYRTEGVEGTEEVSGSVKAINNTTVEVTLDEEIGNVEDYKFTIAGLEVKNVAPKQSNKNTLVLTTAVQEGGKEYVVTLNGEEVGKFTGVSAVLPTAIDIVEKSQQNVLGNQVTVKAKVTVATGDSAAGIPVTFNIVNDYSLNTATLNQPIVAEATTDANGVATYTYTRYASTAHNLVTTDEVQAYATGKATLRSFGKVYWAAIQPLTITPVGDTNSINNGAAKQYKVKFAGSSSAGDKVNVAFKENLNILPDKVVKSVNVTDANGRSLGFPGQYVTSTGDQTQGGYKVVQLTLDAKGETTFTLTGSNATVTPIVFKDLYNNTTNTDPSYGRFDATELFAEAPAVTFGKVQTLGVAVENLGVSQAAAYKNTDLVAANYLASVADTTTVVKTLPENLGGRTYKATVTNPDGKTVVSNTPVQVSVAFGTAQNKPNANTLIYLYDFNAQKVVKVRANAGANFEYTLLTDAKGQVSFKLIGEKDSYATPTVFVETGDAKGLDKNDLQQAGEIVYFGDAKVEKAKLLVDGEAENNTVVNEETEFVYSTVDQNDNEYESTQTFTVTFAVSTLGNVANVKLGTGTAVTGGYGNANLPGTVDQGSTRTYAVQSSGSKASIKVDAANGTQVSVTATAGAFPASTASVTFAKLNNEGIAEGQEVRGKVVAIDRANNRILLSDSKAKNVYELTYGTSELYHKGSIVTESTFEAKGSLASPASLVVGNELHFVQKNGTTPAKFDNLGYISGIDLNPATRTLNTIRIFGDSTAKAKNYDFGAQTIKANVVIEGNRGGNDVTLSNGTIKGDVTVGSTTATSSEILNDFAVNDLDVEGTVTVNQGDGNTIEVLGNSNLNKLVLNTKEHINIDSGATVKELVINPAANNSFITGTGLINRLVLNGATLASNTITPGETENNTTFTGVVTATADSVTLTFASALSTADTVSVDVLTTTTTGETATVATLDTATATATSKKFIFTTPLVNGQVVQVTLNGVKYRATYTANPTLTFTRFN